MRTTMANNTFLRTSNNPKTTQDDKLWLNIIGEKQQIGSQIGIAFLDSAKDEYNAKEDVAAFVGKNIRLYTTGTQKDLIIDAQSSFNSSKVIPLGVTNLQEEQQTFNFNIEKAEGQLSNSSIYLEDRVLGIVHNLSKSDYSIKLPKGVYENRFYLRFDNNVKSTSEDVMESDLIVKAKNENIHISVTGNQNIYAVEIADIYQSSFGRTKYIINLTSVAKKQTSIDINPNHKLLFIKVTLDNGDILTKKILR